MSRARKRRHKRVAAARVVEAASPKRARRRVILALLVGSAVAVGFWFRSGPADNRSPGPVDPVSPIRFEAGDGVDFVLNNGSIPDKPVPDSTLGGVGVFDCDNDGLLDIYFANGAHLPTLEKANPSFHNRLYRNLGGRRFADVTADAGVAGAGYSMGVAAGDYDNDGWVDIYVAGVRRNLLYRNLGACRFEDVTEAAGVSARQSGTKPWSVAASWLDYDNDGSLDLFVVNYLDWSWANNRVCGDEGRRLACSPAHYEGLPNILYRNRGDGTFEDASRSTGIAAHVGKGMSAAVADYDRDGFSDVFVTNDSVRDFLFHNRGGERFEEVGVQAGVAFTGDGIPVSSMGVDFRDLNNDGAPDITITALAGETFPLFLNRGRLGFSDGTYASRIGLESSTMSGWSNGAFDFDNDGDKDIFTANSHVSENVELYRSVKYRLRNAVFQAQADGSYRDVAEDSGPAMQMPGAHRGAAFGDLDNDGRIDAVVSAIGSLAGVFFNDSLAGNWLILDLEGTRSNRSGIGARVTVTDASGRVQHNHASTSVGYASSSDSRVHFGTGASRIASRIEIRWPSGVSQALEGVETGQVVSVKEPMDGSSRKSAFGNGDPRRSADSTE